ncbi:uncharacterized protein LOC128959238 [Oppia nitens]|uniref:uncharacterized protein LOC128959238 n=1 Tax=Oppia nitens TaxID=1686743 RepID=UPI0023D9EF39|nr:uncharacterized protein LOC128959238 [Oppia nitens]
MPKFEAMFDTIVQQVLDNSLNDDIRDQLKPLIRKINNDEEEDSDTRIYALGWAHVFMAYYIVLLDDIMDDNQLAGDKQCWHTLPGVGMTALNDSTILMTAINTIIKLYFRNQPNYVDIIEYIQKIIGNVAYGQLLDLQFTKSYKSDIDLNSYTIEQLTINTKYKHAYFVVLGQFQLAIYASGKTNLDNDHDQIEQSLTKLAILDGFFNDYEHYFKPESTIIDELLKYKDQVFDEIEKTIVKDFDDSNNDVNLSVMFANYLCLFQLFIDRAIQFENSNNNE